MTLRIDSLLLLATLGLQAPGALGPQEVLGARADQVAPSFEGIRWSAEEEPAKARSKGPAGPMRPQAPSLLTRYEAARAAR
ncbi:MAG: hypothetical protein P8M11_11040 [Planctomycetota bacterium]|nr:hypothetical protein [Planctomycetota bacterium]